MTAIPGISAELVRKYEITANFHRCNIYFEKFCKRAGWYGGNAVPPDISAENMKLSSGSSGISYGILYNRFLSGGKIS